MNFSSLIEKINEIENSERKSIFESIGQGDQYFITWEREIHPILCEVALQPNQIQQLFKSIEAGAGRTGLGKAADAVKGATDKISDVWFNKFGGMLQSSAPVQAFDQKWEDLKSSIAAKNPQLAAKLVKYGEFAKNNPNLHKFLLAIGGSLAAAVGVAAAGGLGAGALAVGTGTGVAVGILNIADRLLQGQKASTAIGRGATAGAVAGLTAGAIAKAKDALDQLGAVKVIKQGATANFNGQTFYMKPEEAKIFNDAVRANAQAAANVKPGGIVAMMGSNEARMAEATAKILAKVSDPAYQEAAYKMLKVGTTIDPGMLGQAANAASSALAAVQPILSAITGQAAGGKNPTAVKESLTYSQINELFGFTGNKVDASKLEKAWKAAGSPTDSEQVANVLQDQGVDPSVISKAFTDLSIPAPAGKIDPTLDDPDTNGPTTQASSSAAQPATVTPSPAAGPLKAADIVKNLNDIWTKATADQGSETTSPAVQNQIRAMAKQAAMTGQTFEGKYSKQVVGVYSKFLGKHI